MVLILKLYLCDAFDGKPIEVRRLTANSDLTTYFQLLKAKVQDLFGLSPNIKIHWKDAENDNIAISTDEELAQAVANAEDGLLRLYVEVVDVEEQRKNVEKRMFVEKSGSQKSHKPNKKDDQGPTSDQEHAAFTREHPNVTCDGCDKNIFGIRYKCLVCDDYDLCSACNAKNTNHEHDMIKLVKPIHVGRDFFLGGRKIWRHMFGRRFPFQQAEEGYGASTSQGSPTEDFQKAFHNFVNGDFVPAQKLLTEGFGQFLKGFQGVDIKLDGCPFQGPSASKKQKTDQATSPTKEATATETVPMETAEKNPSSEEIAAGDATPPKTPVDAPVLAPSKPAENAPKGLFQSQASQQMSDLNTAVKSLVIEAAPAVAETLIDLEQSTPPSGDPSCMDGWTLLQGDDITNNEAAAFAAAAACSTGTGCLSGSVYPSLEKISTPQDSTSQNAMDVEQPAKEPEAICSSKDPKIINAVLTMLNMGFTNEGGWLERLLDSHGGNINEVLDALYPLAQRY